MNTPRRIAALLLTAALSFGIVGTASGPADASKDTTWPLFSDNGQTSSSRGDTTWPL